MTATAPVAGPRRAAVLGSPIAHSLSPALHRAAYVALGLDGWRYDAVEVVQEELAGFVRGLDGTWAGLSLTMPLKRAVLPLLAGRSDLAAAVGAVNTVTFPDGVPHGDNTDVHGIVAALAGAGVGVPSTAAVLGGGATAASAIAALRELGCTDPVVHVRDPTRARHLFEAADRLGVRPRTAPLDVASVAASLRPPDGAPGGSVLVSTLPAGAADALAPALARPPDPSARAAPAVPVLLDVVYAPWPTVLGEAASAAGWRVVGGLEMLLHQAGEQVRLMTGRPGPLEEMRAAAAARLRRAVEQPSSRPPEVPTPSA